MLYLRSFVATAMVFLRMRSEAAHSLVDALSASVGFRDMFCRLLNVACRVFGVDFVYHNDKRFYWLDTTD